MFLLQVAFVTMFAFRTHMLRALETQLTKIFPIDMPDACTAHLLHLSTGEHDEHIVRWAGLGFPQPGTEDVPTKARKKPRTRRSYTAEQSCDEKSEEVLRLAKAWIKMFKVDIAKVKILKALSHMIL